MFQVPWEFLTNQSLSFQRTNIALQKFVIDIESKTVIWLSILWIPIVNGFVVTKASDTFFIEKVTSTIRDKIGKYIIWPKFPNTGHRLFWSFQTNNLNPKWIWRNIQKVSGTNQTINLSVMSLLPLPKHKITNFDRSVGLDQSEVIGRFLTF